MSKAVDDLKSGIKGIRGMGDVLRGEVMGATDRLFESKPDKPHHAADERSEAKNQAIADKGRSDVQNMDSMLSRHEWKRKEAREAGTAGTGLEREDVHTHHGFSGASHHPTTTTHHNVPPTTTTHHNVPPAPHATGATPELPPRHGEAGLGQTTHQEGAYPPQTAYQNSTMKPAESMGQSHYNSTAQGENFRYA